MDSGGRPNEESAVVEIHPYRYYTGLTAPDEMQTGTETAFRIVSVNNEGEPVAGRELTYRIYLNRQYWWWEYDNRRDYRLHYKSDATTERVKEGTIISETGPSPWPSRLKPAATICLRSRIPAEVDRLQGFLYVPPVGRTSAIGRRGG